MLFSIQSNGDTKQVTRLPHEQDFNRWRSRLSDSDYQAACDELDGRLETNEVNTSSWIPGEDWTGTVFQPLYEACGRDSEAAARFFGLILWKVVMDHGQRWSFGRYEKDGVPIEGITYFRID